MSISDRDTLLRSIDESLERLNTDYIDLFLIHWPDHTRSFEEPMRALEDAKAAGKIPPHRGFEFQSGDDGGVQGPQSDRY